MWVSKMCAPHRQNPSHPDHLEVAPLYCITISTRRMQSEERKVSMVFSKSCVYLVTHSLSTCIRVNMLEEIWKR